MHQAAYQGLIEEVVALLSTGSIDVDGGSLTGLTPLMAAALNGRSHVVEILLLHFGASVFMIDDNDATALHVSAQHGHMAVTKMLLKAGSPLEAVDVKGCTPLHLAASQGHAEVMSVLIDAGGDIDSATTSGATPLFYGALDDHLNVVRELLRKKANPLLGLVHSSSPNLSPLDIAATKGHLGVASELVKQVGIHGCGGGSGQSAFRLAASTGHLDIVALLADAGVKDTTSIALGSAARHGHEASVRFLLKQQEKREAAGLMSYVDRRDTTGTSPVFHAVLLCRPCSPRIVRSLVDAGADTASVLRVNDPVGRFLFNGTPLSWVTRCLREKEVNGEHATQEQLQSLEGLRRLLSRVEAVHAISWLWRSDVPGVARAEGGACGIRIASSSLASMLPLMKRRARRRGMPSAAMSRWVATP